MFPDISTATEAAGTEQFNFDVHNLTTHCIPVTFSLVFTQESC